MHNPYEKYVDRDEMDRTLFSEVYEKENEFYKSGKWLTISELIKILKRAKELYGDAGISVVYDNKIDYDLDLRYDKTKNQLLF